ncbi:MAG: flagellar motor switch protein FliG [Alphaproteobacteria bacterium]
MDETYAKKLSGAEKAAIILLSIEEANATKIFSHMNEDEIKEISSAMSTLGVIKPEIVEQLINEFNNEVSSSVSFVGNAETTERLLGKVLNKDQLNSLMEEIRGPAGKNTWDKLGNVNEEVLASYLKNEYPQTIALIMSKLTSAHAAKVLSALPDELTFEVMVRMLNMEPVKKEILDRVERILRAEFISTLTKTQKYDTNEVMAEIFNNLDRNNEAKFMTMLENRVPEYAEKIKDLMFTFDDLGKLNTPAIQALLRNVDKAKLTIALKGASEDLKKLFTNNMSQRAAKILIEDMQSLGPVRLKEVDEAQSIIVNMAREMAAKGEIQISSDNSDDELIY